MNASSSYLFKCEDIEIFLWAKASCEATSRIGKFSSEEFSPSEIISSSQMITASNLTSFQSWTSYHRLLVSTASTYNSNSRCYGVVTSLTVTAKLNFFSHSHISSHSHTSKHFLFYHKRLKKYQISFTVSPCSAGVGLFIRVKIHKNPVFRAF